MKYDEENIFNKIISGQMPCDRVYEDNDIIAFKDITPSAPVHILVIPKAQYISFDDFMMSASDKEVHHFFKTVRKIAHDNDLASSGYRVVTNHGHDACQTVMHYHVHILGKKNLGMIASSE